MTATGLAAVAIVRRAVHVAVFSERKVTGDPYYYEFEAMLGYRSLEDSIELFSSKGQLGLTRLVPDLTGVDPDDAFR